MAVVASSCSLLLVFSFLLVVLTSVIPLECCLTRWRWSGNGEYREGTGAGVLSVLDGKQFWRRREQNGLFFSVIGVPWVDGNGWGHVMTPMEFGTRYGDIVMFGRFGLFWFPFPGLYAMMK